MGAGRLVPCEARTFGRPCGDPLAAPSAEPGRWAVRAVRADISCWCWQELSWPWGFGEVVSWKSGGSLSWGGGGGSSVSL